MDDVWDVRDALDKLSAGQKPVKLKVFKPQKNSTLFCAMQLSNGHIIASSGPNNSSIVFSQEFQFV